MTSPTPRRFVIAGAAVLAASAPCLARGPVAATPTVASPLRVAPAPAPPGVTALDLDPAAYAAVRGLDGLVMTGFALDAATRVDLVLERFDVLSAGARVVLGSPDGDVELPRPDVALFRGRVANDPGSSVFLAISPHGTNGFIDAADGRHVVSAGRAGRGGPVIYNLDAIAPGTVRFRGFDCGVDALEAPPAGPRADAGPPGPGGAPRALLAGGGGSCGIARIAVETDWEFTFELFDGDTDASSTYVLELMAAISEIYLRDVATSLEVSFLRVYDNPGDPWTQSNIFDQLEEFQDYYNNNEGGTPRDTAHFMTSRQLSGAGGVAYLPGLCQGDEAYGLSAYMDGFFPYPLEDGNAFNWDVVVVAHELGHNFGAPHTHDMVPPIDQCGFLVCDNADQGTIMSYCHICDPGLENINLRFHERIIDEQMVPYLTGDLPCELSADPPGIIQSPQGTTACVGEPAVFTVVATGGPVYQWRKDGTDIPGATAATYVIAAVTLADTGLYDVVVSNSCGEATSAGASLAVLVECCPWDIANNDNFVGVDDFLLLFALWGQPAAGPPDFDNDGVVDVDDLLDLFAHWGSCG